MVDIAAASSASSQIQVDAGRSSSQENAAIAQNAQQDKIEGSADGRSTVEADTGPDVGNNVDVSA
ncbi:MAG: hypothetical protein HOH19_03275 [Kordiimonadaceae bacterium]|jgi:hypothetical protein|nr:hypothetical protein [Kordiimonadaceae bacterium]MBT6031572.1 hypothetical protein [Kordiimonadaceae bacterium]